MSECVSSAKSFHSEECKILIDFDTFSKRIEKSDYKWIEKGLGSLAVVSTLSKRSVILMTVKQLINIYKTEYIVTVFRMYRKDKYEHGVIYAEIYSHISDSGAVVHDFAVTGPTFASADGEYRHDVVRVEQIEKVFDNLDYAEDIEKILLKDLSGEAHIECLIFYPATIRSAKNFTEISRTFLRDIDNKYLSVKSYIYAWFIRAIRLEMGTLENHLINDYMDIVYSEALIKYGKKMLKSIDAKIRSNYMRILSYYDASLEFITDIQLGIKILPLRANEMTNLGNVKYGTWREVYINSKLNDLVINGFTANLPVFSDWFLINANSRELYDNSINLDKHTLSELTKTVIRDVDYARRMTYKIVDTNSELFLNVQMEGLSQKLRVSLDYAEKELIMSEYSLCYISQHLGHTFADLMKFQNTEKYIYTWGNYCEFPMFSKVFFEYIYTLYCLNLHKGVIHGDLHMNNITIWVSFPRNKDAEGRDISHDGKAGPQKYELFDVARQGEPIYNNIGDMYIFRDMGRKGALIDFSRAYMSHAELSKDHSEEIVDAIIVRQRQRMLSTYKQLFPDFMDTNSDKVEAAMLRNFDAFFKLFTASDVYYLAGNLRNFMIRNTEDKRIIDLIDMVRSESMKYLTTEMQKLFEETKPKPREFPVYEIIKKCFGFARVSEFKMTLYNDKPDIFICDIFSTAFTFRYSSDDMSRFPRSNLFCKAYDKCAAADMWRKKYKEYEKHLKKSPPEKELATAIDDTRRKSEENKYKPRSATKHNAEIEEAEEAARAQKAFDKELKGKKSKVTFKFSDSAKKLKDQ